MALWKRLLAWPVLTGSAWIEDYCPDEHFLYLNVMLPALEACDDTSRSAPLKKQLVLDTSSLSSADLPCQETVFLFSLKFIHFLCPLSGIITSQILNLLVFFSCIFLYNLDPFAFLSCIYRFFSLSNISFNSSMKHFGGHRSKKILLF